MQPYLLAYCTTGISEKNPEKNSRSVMFSVASLEKNTLFATCKHALLSGRKKDTGSYLFDKDGHQMELGKILKNIIFLHKFDLDLVFVELKISVPQSHIIINENLIPSASLALSHARNIVGSPEFAGQTFCIKRKEDARREHFKAIYDVDRGVYQSLHNKKSFPLAKKYGFQTFYNVLEMQSWPGVSGSPLWDDRGGIRGMVCAGDTEGTGTESILQDGKFRLMYLPAKTIMKEANTVLRSLRTGNGLKKIS